MAMVPDFLASLNDQEFKNSLIDAKNNPEMMANPMAIMTLVLPKLSEILKKNGFVEPNAPQQFFMFVFMNQNDTEIKDLAEKLKNALLL
jgi:hypothetical protein